MTPSATKLVPKLTGVPETLLWPLHNRATEARRKRPLLRDPEAVRIASLIDYPYEAHFGPAHQDHVLRALRFDEQIRAFLRRHPEVTVAALGDGLETQFHRVDNGRLRWLSVDLPESIVVRQTFLPDSERSRNLACSALDFRWMDAVGRGSPVVVTAQGLLMYFEPDEVRGLIAACAESFPGGCMIFDTIPRSYSRSTLDGKRKTADYQLPRMPWGINANELDEIRSYHSGIQSVAEFSPGRGRGWRMGVAMPIRRALRLLSVERTCFVRLRF